MRKKIIGILICMMLVATSALTTLIIPEETHAEAYSKANKLEEGMGLDLDYIWNQTLIISNVIYEAYLPEDIPKGRSFGSKGGYYTVDQILKPEMEAILGSENVTTEQLQHINGVDYNYSNIINVSDFQFTVYTEDNATSYSFENPIPKKEMYFLPTKGKKETSNYTRWTDNHTFNNITIVPIDMTKFPPLTEIQNNASYYNISDYDLLSEKLSIMIGILTYIASNDTVPDPDEQEAHVFLIDDIDGVQEKLDNITDAEGVIIIDTGEEGIEYADVSNCSNLVVSIDNDSGTAVKTLLENENILVDNVFKLFKNLTFTYNLTDQGWWPADSEFMFIQRIQTHVELQSATWFCNFLLKSMAFIGKPRLPHITDFISCVSLNLRFWRLMNEWHEDTKCRGIILYDTYNYHFMLSFNTNNKDHIYRLPIITVNRSIGDFLNNNRETTTLSGYAFQEYLKETSEQPGAIGDNIYGSITIDNSPGNATAICSNRYDGMWGQTPGDSGVGTAIVLGLMKYFKDHPSVNPKYNLRFLFTAAEECGLLGARYHNESNKNESIQYWLFFDQLGFSQSDCGLNVFYKNWIYKKIIETIIEESDYTKYQIFARNEDGEGSEMKIASKRNDCDSFCLAKDQDRRWDHWHRAGNNFTEGDSMKYIDRDDVNATTKLALAIIKYFMINPDCWFNGSVTYTAVDSPHDTDTDIDSINATFSVKSSLPIDKVRVKAKLNTWPANDTILWKNFDFNATSEGVTKTITVTLPPNTTGVTEGNYHLFLELYNSTGRIDEIAKLLGGSEDDIDNQSNYSYLHPRGNTPPNKPANITGPHTLQVLETGTFNTSTIDMNDDHMQYQWYWEPYSTNAVGTYASGETCSKTHKYLCPWWKREIYVRARENYYGYLFDGPLSLILHRYGNWSEWSEPFNVTVKLFTNLDISCTALSAAQNAMSSMELPSIVNVNSIYYGNAIGGTTPYNYQWTFNHQCHEKEEETVDYSFEETGNYSVVLNITDFNGYWNEISVNVSVVNISASFNDSIPSCFADPDEIILFNDTSAVTNGYHIVNWTWDFGDGNQSYDRNTTHLYGAFGTFNVTLTVRDNVSRTDECRKQITTAYDTRNPEITYIGSSPDTVGFGYNVSIAVDVMDNDSGINSVYVNITYPDNSTLNTTMTHVINDTYYFLFDDTWQTGMYNYSIWVIDYANNTDYASGFNFTVSADAIITVCTTKDTYTGNEYINLTDPPGSPSPSLGYELLDDGAVLHLWNQYDHYYFNTTSGIQLTNHKDEYWSHNVLMLGYYNNDQWNLLYRTDELTGFNKDIEIDESSYVNVTLWKDLSYAGYPFRLAIRYHLSINDCDLTVIPYIKNLGTTSIPYVLGFGWELKDIQINRTTQGDYIIIDGESYYLNQTLENVYTDLDETLFYLMDDSTETQTQSLYVRWDPDLTYKLLVKSRVGQQNAPVTLFIRVGTLAVGQQKSTSLQWYDASQETYYFDSYNEYEVWDGSPENMVDGSIESFAYTNVDDLQICKSNTCPGDDLGTIQKVELRAHCYKEGEEVNITLQPMLEEKTGQNYTTAPGNEPEWTQWFDITTDLGHGGGGYSSPWTWGEIQSLTCNVISSITEEMLYCSRVEIRVTYNTAPSVSNPSPLHGTNGVTLQPWLNITVSDPDEDTMNVTWYTNSTTTLLTLCPNANGSITELSKYPSSTPANYQCVDETVANDSDYVHWTGSSWKKDTYSLPNHTNQTRTINKITVYARCARAGSYQYPATNNSAKIVIRINETYSYGSAFIPPYSAMEPYTYTTYSNTWMVNPITEEKWTWTDIDNLQAGISFIGNQGTSRCTHLYIVVNYTNPNTWYQFGENSSVGDGVYRQQLLNASVNGQWWYWKVKADDGASSTWSSVYKFYTGYQSKIENIGETNISGYLLMQIQYYEESSEEWLLDVEVVNESIRQFINISEQLGLDQFFNGEVNTEELTHGAGTYRVYAAFRDPEGNILTTDDEVELVSWWQFSKTD